MKSLACRFRFLLPGLLLVVGLLLTGSGCQRAPSKDETAATAGVSAASDAAPKRSAAPLTSAAPTRDPARGLWWKVTSERATMYLLGSIHVARTDLYPLDPRIERAFAATDTLVLEVDLTKLNPLSVALKMSKLAKYAPGDSLDRHVSIETWRKLERHAPGGMMSASTLKQFRPWFVATTLLQSKLEKLGYDQAHGLDQHFADQAKGNKVIVGLETIDGQIALLADMPEQTQKLMLEQTLEDLDQIEPMMKKVLDGWREGNPKPLEEELMAPMRTPQFQPVFDMLFVTRNRRWEKALLDHLGTNKTYFVVVGAGHLIGKDSVVDLLERRGYTVAAKWRKSR